MEDINMSMSKKVILPSVILSLLGSIVACQNASFSASTSLQKSTADLSAQVVQQVKISNSNDNIYVKVGNKLKVDYDGPKNNAPIVKIKNHYLEVSSPHHFSLNFFSRNTYNVTITLPQNELKNFSINSSNVNVKVEEIHTDKGNIVTSNGNIIISKLISRFGFELSSSNGNITAEHVNFSGYNLSNSNGSNKFRGMHVPNSFAKITSKSNVLDINNSNGDIDIN